MKPRNERERECMRLSAKLPALTSAQIAYAIEHCFEHRAAVRSTKHHTYYCLECGETFQSDNARKQVVCPYCGQHLTPDGVRAKKKEIASFQIITTIEGWQVVRTIFFERMTRCKHQAEYDYYECVQRYMRPGKKDTILALRKTFTPLYYDHFDRYSELDIKLESNVSSYYGNPYDDWAKVVYPRQSVLPVVKRNGWCQWLKENTKFSESYHRLLDNPHYETIAKTGRFDLWKELKEGFINQYWPQVKMVIRHDYHPADFKLWLDMIEMAVELGKDIHSPKYVLPDNLQQMHDYLMRKKEAAEREKEIEEHRSNKPQFVKQFGKYLGICIVVGDITIRPLQNFAEFFDEGKAMHHCVATYFGRAGSLILSARSGDKRLATIELDTKDFSVVQCRTVCNKKPERYDEICAILARHKQDFAKAAKRKVS